MGNYYEDYTFFAIEGGALRKAIDQWRAERSAAYDANKAFAEEVGAVGTVSNTRVCGVMTKDGKVLEGWKVSRQRTSDGGSYLIPDRKTKLGRELQKRLDALTSCGAERLSDLAIGSSFIFSGSEHSSGRGIALRNCTLEIFGGVDVLGVPNVWEGGVARPYAEPEGGRRLKLSEYFAMKEANASAEHAA
jgi:hypothetical protein